MSGAPISRRGFIARSSLAAAAASLRPSSHLFAQKSNKLNVAFIGVGRRGAKNLAGAVETGAVNVTALVDVDEGHLRATAAQFPDARVYRDFRRLYDDARLFDAVVISTPEQTHAYATMPALELGKHVYCEKPLTHNIGEARRVAEAAERAGVATQMGTQIHSMPNYRRVVELIRTGAIGPVREAHVWVSRAWGLQSAEEAARHDDPIHVTARPAAGQQPPADLDWDLWLGPAPARPYHEVYVPGPKWYRWWDFGSGTMSDLGSHWNDLPFWALELDAPRTVEAFGIPPHPEIAPASMTAVYEFPARGDRGPVRLNWYQGEHKPRLWEAGEIPQWKNGVLFVGDRGMLLSDYRNHVLLPEEDFRDFVPPEPFIPDSPGHYAEWVIAAATGSPTGSRFQYSGPLTETNHLASIAYRMGKKLEWDANAMRVTNCAEANTLVAREPRPGWSLTSR